MSATETTTDTEQKEMQRERAIHGAEWDRIHGGYFASHAVAEPLTKAIQTAARRALPQVIVDLGGGTGFMLHELARHGLAANARLINLDASAEQLEQVHDPRVKHIQVSLPELRRAQFAKKDERALFIMRSVLHYFGKDRFVPNLKKLRRLMRPGERFIHQTACFEDAAAAKCLNELYQLMGTGKWYPMVTALCMALTEAGWQVEASNSAPPLPLGSQDLARRYNLAPARLVQIQKALAANCGSCSKVFETTRRGFTAYLPYTIFTCVAV